MSIYEDFLAARQAIESSGEAIGVWAMEPTPRPPQIRWQQYRQPRPPFDTVIDLIIERDSVQPDFRASVVIDAYEFMRISRDSRQPNNYLAHIFNRLLQAAVASGVITAGEAHQELVFLFRTTAANYRPEEFRPWRATDWDLENKEAKQRARELLLSCLTDEQKQDFCQSYSFTVIGSYTGQRYRIRYGTAYNVDTLDKDGCKLDRYCAGPSGDIEIYDFMLAQKLLLEADEPSFLAVANIYK